MMSSRRTRPFWRMPETRMPRPELWLGALALVGMLLVEVWQNSHMAELCLTLEQSRTAISRGRARLEFVQAARERRTTRAELAPLASELGLAPADAQQVVSLPSEYLVDGRGATPRGDAPLALAWAERASRVLVPEATARDRIGH
jgi:hypothetical protein